MIERPFNPTKVTNPMIGWNPVASSEVEFG
jgi:hypothetical protein